MSTQNCSYCKSKIEIEFLQIKEGGNYFCHELCRELFHYPNFCPACIAETTDLSPGGTTVVNGIGSVLYGGTTRMEAFRHNEFGGSGKCPTCFSVIKTKWWALCYFPLIRLKTYRIKNVGGRHYLGRFLPPENMQVSISRTANNK